MGRGRGSGAGVYRVSESREFAIRQSCYTCSAIGYASRHRIACRVGGAMGAFSHHGFGVYLGPVCICILTVLQGGSKYTVKYPRRGTPLPILAQLYSLCPAREARGRGAGCPSAPSAGRPSLTGRGFICERRGAPHCIKSQEYVCICIAFARISAHLRSQN